MVEAENREYDERYRHGRHGGYRHVADVGEKRRACHRRCENGRVRQRRHFVAEIGAGNDRPRHDPGVESLRFADADEREPDGRDCRP